MGGRAGFGSSYGKKPEPTKQEPAAFEQRFEYDLTKSASNREKHGIDFEEAKALWGDDKRTVTEAPYATEPRYLVTGAIDNKHWTAIITERNGAIRIISVRRAREKEVINYGQVNN
jgi:uncharacterized DUF497 family protein